MRFIIYLAVGFFGGLLGGMGMGGGTILIPALTVLCGVPQHLAQSANLFSFVPMSGISLKVHAKNGLLDTKDIIWTIVPATVLSVLGAIFVQGVSAGTLRMGFGLFLCVLSVFQFVSAIRAAIDKARSGAGRTGGAKKTGAAR